MNVFARLRDWWRHAFDAVREALPGARGGRRAAHVQPGRPVRSHAAAALPSRIDPALCAPWPEEALLVGGAVRDLLLGIQPIDFDWVAADPATAARRHAARLDGSFFALDEARGQWRVVAHRRAGAVAATGDAAPPAVGGPDADEAAADASPGDTVVHDFVPRPADIAGDLAARDFTIDAIAARPDGSLIDPCGGRADLERRLLRTPDRANLRADPLRVVRAARLAATLGLELDPATAEAIRDVGDALAAGDLERPAWERVGAELDRILASPAAARGVRLLAELDLVRVFLPELERGRGLAQGGFHHLDVLDHQIEALDRLVRGFDDADLALRWATLLHDVGKPDTRSEDGGRVTFYGHAAHGAEQAVALLRRLRAPEARTRRVAALVKEHMVQLPSTERSARRFAHRRRELLPDLLALMLADREASRGPRSSEASRRAYRTAVSRVLAARAEVPDTPPLLDGVAVMRELELAPGPRVGRALDFLREAEAVGDIATADEARKALRRFAEGQGWTEAGRGR